MKSKKLSYLFKFCCILLCLLMTTSIVSVAAPNQGLTNYDNLLFENKKDIPEYNKLSSAQKDALKENGDIVIVSIQDSDSGSSIMPYSVMPEHDISGRIVVSRNQNATRFYLTFYVTWTFGPNIFLTDKIALCWAGGSALISSSCKKYKNGAYVTGNDMILSDIKNNELVAYELKYYSKEFMLQATIDKSYQPGLKNISGGYAHKTIGISDISVGISSDKIINFSASAGTYYNTMSPAFTTAYLY